MDCFTQIDKCVQYSGPSDQSIGIQQNMTQAELNAQLVLLVSQLKAQLDLYKCNTGSSSTDSSVQLSNTVYKEYTLSKCINDISVKSFSYTITASSDITFTYDTSNIISNLPLGTVLETIRVRISKDNNLIANLSGISSGISLKRSEVPSYANFEVRLNSSCGNIILSKSIPLNNESVSSITNFDIQDLGSQQTLNTQEQFNQMIYNEMQKLKSRI